jgi:hypothetical protein
MVGEVSAAGRTGRAGRVWLMAAGCALSGSLFGAAAFGSHPARTAAPGKPAALAGADRPSATPTAAASPDVAPPPQPSRQPPGSDPAQTPPASRAGTPAPSRPASTRKSRPSKRSAPRLTKRPQAWHGADVPFVVGPPPSRGTSSSPAARQPGTGTPDATRSLEDRRDYLSGFLIYSGVGGLTVALGGLLLLGTRRRRW